ncbi:hypothetical protein ABOM_004567 [Aspergillus bombycis]|uniref:Uncharacterized protein n=1 Tax=Aspergillus bombycis TaxID=109264 RepID=A0A1F8A465_9EURO|nr:hypothetical protein ABOM_004567 [Aspergillus bombycis]OGM46530.1 hypothetical protein ABOM_004567 [Aspergillus bombycis]
MLLQDVSANKGYASYPRYSVDLPRRLQLLSPYDKYLYFQAQAPAIMLVSLAPRLESLAFHSLGLQHPLKTYMFQNFLQRAIAEKRDVPGLLNLRSVIFLSDIGELWDDNRLYWDYEVHDCLHLVWELPAIESVRFDAVQPSLDVGMLPPPRSANYTDIMLYHCIVQRPEELDIIIQSAKRLKRFAFTVGGRSELGGDVTMVSSIYTLEFLLTHRHTLEELDLDIQGHVWFREMFEEDRDAFWSDLYDDEDEELEKWETQKKEVLGVESPAPECALRSFPNLKHLSIGTMFSTATLAALVAVG